MKRPSKQQQGPVLPTVNLLSPWSFEAMATRRLRQRLALACLLLVLIIAAGWSVQHLRVGQAQELLAAQQGETQSLTVQTGKLAPVRVFVAAVEQQKITVQSTMQSEIYFSQVLDALATATPPDADVESAIVALAPAAPVAPAPAAGEEPVPEPVTVLPSPCPGPDPFNTRVVVGCITLSGSAANRSAVGDLVIQLGDSALFVEPFISTTTTADGEQVTFTGSVGLSERVFSNRYADLEALLREGGTQ